MRLECRQHVTGPFLDRIYPQYEEDGKHLQHGVVWHVGINCRMVETVTEACQLSQELRVFKAPSPKVLQLHACQGFILAPQPSALANGSC
jgi:hypothetical protein